jgi:hypothetical protein
VQPDRGAIDDEVDVARLCGGNPDDCLGKSALDAGNQPLRPPSRAIIDRDLPRTFLVSALALFEGVLWLV